MWYIDICLYITYIAKSWCAPVSYNFYQVSPLLRLIIYYFWEVFKILPNIYSTSPPCSVPSLFSACIWPFQQQQQQQPEKQASVCIDRCNSFSTAYLLPASESIRTVRAACAHMCTSANVHKCNVHVHTCAYAHTNVLNWYQLPSFRARPSIFLT